MEPNFVEQLFFGLFFAPRSEGIYRLLLFWSMFASERARSRISVRKLKTLRKGDVLCRRRSRLKSLAHSGFWLQTFRELGLRGRVFKLVTPQSVSFLNDVDNKLRTVTASISRWKVKKIIAAAMFASSRCRASRDVIKTSTRFLSLSSVTPRHVAAVRLPKRLQLASASNFGRFGFQPIFLRSASTARLPELTKLRPDLKTHEDIYRFSVEQVRGLKRAMRSS